MRAGKKGPRWLSEVSGAGRSFLRKPPSPQDYHDYGPEGSGWAVLFVTLEGGKALVVNDDGSHELLEPEEACHVCMNGMTEL